jgi:cell division protein FtsB
VSPRRDGKRWLRLAVIFVMCVLLADALVGDRGLAQTRRSNREYKQAVRALHDLRRENAVLREQQRRLREDGRAIEALARQELGLIRPGEILFVVGSGR